MIQSLKDIQQQSSAIFEQDSSIPITFGNDEQVSTLLTTSVLICDRSHWGLLQLTGKDRFRFLHNQTTNNIDVLKAGEGCDTVFVNSTGRTLDLATAYVRDEEIWVLVSPKRRTFLMEWMDRYLFPMDKVELKDISEEKAIFTLISQKSTEIINKIGGDNLIALPHGSHKEIIIEEITVTIGIGSGLNTFGYNLIVDSKDAAKLWLLLINLGVIPIGETAWKTLSIHQGRPMVDRELTEDYNPLEAGLWDAISFDKGCYIGQETIARLNTYKGVKQRLWGIELNQSVEPQTPIMVNGEKVGILTSCIEQFGLGYIRTKAGGEGLNVQIGDATGKVVAVSFLSHDYHS
ncbi:MAG: folate-binding protein YgfZ [Microcystaceae cyanobacterium]